MTDKRDQRIVQSESAIVEASIQTFLVNPAAGMAEIAAASGVGRTTLYRHFESREVLLKAITLKCLAEIDEALQPVSTMTGRAALEKTFELLIPVADRYRFLNSLWSEVSDDPEINRKLNDSNSGMDWLLDQAKTSGEIDPELPNIWLSTFFDTTLYAAWSLLGSGDIDAEQVARLAIRSFFEGCASSEVLNNSIHL